MPKDLEKILTAANEAPSGENCQPWRFLVRGFTVELHLAPERDTSHYSWGQRASYLANGAALENLTVAATVEGYVADVSYFPNPADPYHVATVTLTKSPSVIKDPLADFISARVTNRKPYSSRRLTSGEIEKLSHAVSDEARIMFAESRKDIRALAKVGATNEEVMLSNRSLHQFFFSHVTWTKEEDNAKKIGFYIKTLELPPPTVALFKLIRHWSVMKFLGKLGFHRMAGIQNAMTYAASGAIGGVIIRGKEPLDFVKAGRAVERMWLTATSLGLSMQPMTGVLFFMLKLAAGEGDVFSETQRAEIERGYKRMQKIFNTKDTVAFMFRTGRGPAPSAHASRFALSDAVTVIS